MRKQIPGVMGRRLRVQEFVESNLDVPSRESRMSFRRLPVRPSEERDDACCSCDDDCPKRQPSRSRFTPESAPSLAMGSSMRSQRHHPSENHSGWLRDLSSTMAWMSALLGPFGPGFLGRGVDENSRR